jgi:hypothetical protein
MSDKVIRIPEKEKRWGKVFLDLYKFLIIRLADRPPG